MTHERKVGISYGLLIAALLNILTLGAMFTTVGIWAGNMEQSVRNQDTRLTKAESKVEDHDNRITKLESSIGDGARLRDNGSIR